MVTSHTDSAPSLISANLFITNWVHLGRRLLVNSGEEGMGKFCREVTEGADYGLVNRFVNLRHEPLSFYHYQNVPRSCL